MQLITYKGLSIIEDIYFRIAVGKSESGLSDRGSRFIGFCAAVTDEDAAKKLLIHRRQLHHNATHHCWAIRIGNPSDTLERSSDDGEPSGSAGRPILDRLRKTDIYNAITVVTRWFGGTKLGRGGLVRAYGKTAGLAIAEISTERRRPMVQFEAVCGYEYVRLIEKLSVQFDGSITNRIFTDVVMLNLTIPVFHAEAIVISVRDQGAGRIVIEKIG